MIMSRMYALTVLNWSVGCVLIWHAWTNPMPFDTQMSWLIFGLMYMSMDTPTRDDGAHVLRLCASASALACACWLYLHTVT